MVGERGWSGLSGQKVGRVEDSGSWGVASGVILSEGYSLGVGNFL